MKYETKFFEIRFVSTSRDLRTNVWEFKCKKCRKVFKPQTTALSVRTIECEKCTQTEIINYNEL